MFIYVRFWEGGLCSIFFGRYSICYPQRQLTQSGVEGSGHACGRPGWNRCKGARTQLALVLGSLASTPSSKFENTILYHLYMQHASELDEQLSSRF